MSALTIIAHGSVGCQVDRSSSGLMAEKVHQLVNWAACSHRLVPGSKTQLKLFEN